MDWGNVRGTVQSAAILSDDGVYRYSLERYWGTGERFVLFAMLNPSTADASLDDPTIRRCMGFARSWGYDGLLVWNLYAFRATNPGELERVEDPVGRENQVHLWEMLGDAALIVAAWGAKPGRGGFDLRARVMFYGPFYDRDVYCLGRCKNGEPRHPLYVRGDQQPELYHARAA